MGMGDVMQYLQVSRQYVDHLIDVKKLRCQRISTGKVFLASDVVSFEKERQKKGNIRSKKSRK